MDWTVCSRETERDYTWDTTHAGPVSAKNAQRFFAPAFEGSITRSRFAALLRSPNSPPGVILCVSVSTNRRDFSRTPIRTLTVLRAETPEETGLLATFFAECLRKPDKETLYNPESKITQAVESLYQTKKPDEFLTFCKSLKPADGKECTLAPFRCVDVFLQRPRWFSVRHDSRTKMARRRLAGGHCWRFPIPLCAYGPPADRRSRLARVDVRPGNRPNLLESDHDGRETSGARLAKIRSVRGNRRSSPLRHPCRGHCTLFET